MNMCPLNYEYSATPAPDIMQPLQMLRMCLLQLYALEFKQLKTVGLKETVTWEETRWVFIAKKIMFWKGSAESYVPEKDGGATGHQHVKVGVRTYYQGFYSD